MTPPLRQLTRELREGVLKDIGDLLFTNVRRDKQARAEKTGEKVPTEKPKEQRSPHLVVATTTSAAGAKQPEKDAKEPEKKPEKWISAGGVVLPSATLEGLAHVLLIAPKGKYGGYSWTFPKGRVEEGEDIVKTAKREVREESGVEASLLPGGYLGTGSGTMSVTHYYMMVRVGGHPGQGTDGESAEVAWKTWAEAFKLISGSSRDRKILMRAWDYVRKLRRKLM